PVLVPGKPEESRIVKRIRAGEMPPRTRLVEVSVKPPEPTEIDVLVRWIAAGAPQGAVAPGGAPTAPHPPLSDKDRHFWAFRPPPLVTAPTVRHAERVRNPIDAFIQQRLEQRGLTLAPEADRTTLFRRAYFDLTGLPPGPEEVRTFLADRGPDA